MVSSVRFWFGRLWNYCTSRVYTTTNMTFTINEEKGLIEGQRDPNDTLQEGMKQARAERKQHKHEPMLTVTGDSGTVYSVLKVVGKGGFGEVYKSEVSDGSTIEDIPQFVAIKAEQPKYIEMEIEILNAIKNSIHFCTLYDRGFDPNSGHYFIVMNLLGPNLSFIRKSMPRQHLTFRTAIRVAIQMLSALEQLHSKGFVSRDVKPSNFAIGLPTQRRRLVYMLDFGIASCYLNANGTPKKQSSSCSWRGTTRYCPLANHRRMSPSPKDDVESWLYSVIELLIGSLPWASLDKNAKEQTYKLKLECRTRNKNSLFKKCPEEFERFLNTIDSYSYYDMPNYNKFFVTLTRILDRNKISFTDIYDWEFVSNRTFRRMTTHPNESS